MYGFFLKNDIKTPMVGDLVMLQNLINATPNGTKFNLTSGTFIAWFENAPEALKSEQIWKDHRKKHIKSPMVGCLENEQNLFYPVQYCR